MLAVIKRWFSKLLRSFWGFIKEVFNGTTELVLAQLKDIAINAVEEMSKTDLSNAQKRNVAFKKIADYANEKGIQARDSLINCVLEIALQYIKQRIT